MSIRQLEFQILVLQKRIHVISITLVGEIENLICRHIGHEASFDTIKKDIHKYIKNKDCISNFIAKMNEYHPSFLQTMSMAIRTCTLLYHHSEYMNDGKIGYIDLGDTIWRIIYEEMIKCIYIYPNITKLPISESLKIIDDILDDVIYKEVPLKFESTPRNNVVPLTSENLIKSIRTTTPNKRTADSVISLASTRVRSNHSVYSSAYSTPHPPNKNKEDDDNVTHMSKGVSAYTRGSKMHIQIPSDFK